MPIPMQSPRAANELRDQADIQGKLPLSLDEIVVPVMVTGGDFPTHVWEGIGAGYAWGRATQDTNPSQFPLIALENPPGSNVIAKVNRFGSYQPDTGPAITVLVDWVVTSVIPETAVQIDRTQPTDTRRFPGITDVQDGKLIWRGFPGQLSRISGPAWTMNVPEGGRIVEECDIVLVPGTSLVAVGGFPDVPIFVLAQWTERPARTAELARIGG